MDLVPARPPGAAHRLRRHRRRDPRDQRGRRRPLPAQAVGPAGGEALPGGRRADRDLARGRRPAASRRSGCVGHRWSARVASRPATSWPATRCRTAGTRSTSPEGARLLDAAGRHRGRRAGGDHRRTARRCVAPTRGRDRRRGRADHRPGHRLLRPDRDRRRPGRAGRAVYGASEGLRTVLVERQATGGQAGQSSPDRELPRLPGRRLRRPAHRPGPPAGREVRRRGAHHPRRRRRWRPRGSARVVQFGDGSEIAAHTRRAGHRRLVPQPGRARASPS